MSTIYITVEGPVTIYMQGTTKGSLRAILGPVKRREVYTMPEANLTTEYWIMASIEPMTDAGNPAPLDGDPVWEIVSGPGDITDLDPPDPLKRWLGSLTPGDTTYLVKADADLGTGSIEVAETFLLHFANPQAANLHGSLGAPVIRPTA